MLNEEICIQNENSYVHFTRIFFSLLNSAFNLFLPFVRPSLNLIFYTYRSYLLLLYETTFILKVYNQNN